MSQTSDSKPSSNESGDRGGFFDLDLDASEESTKDRIRELKRMLFDLVYLVMNADGNEHVSEKMLVRKLEARMEREGSVDVDGRAGDLAPLLDEGPDAIRGRVRELADDVYDRAGHRAEALTKRYMDLLKGLIVADADVSPEERRLFADLCERWGVDEELPTS